MVEIGSTIKARIIRIEPYGLHLQHGQEEVVVLAPEVSWKKLKALSDVVRVNDEIDVFVVRYNYRKKQIVGSIKRLHPQENPYRALSRLEPGVVLPGTVKAIYQDDVTVELPNGAWGHIPRNRLAQEPRMGNPVAVVITDLDVEDGILTLDLAASDVDERETAMAGNQQ